MSTNTSSRRSSRKSLDLSNEGEEIVVAATNAAVESNDQTKSEESKMSYIFSLCNVTIDGSKVTVTPQNATGEYWTVMGSAYQDTRAIFNTVRDAGKFGMYKFYSPNVHGGSSDPMNLGARLFTVCTSGKEFVCTRREVTKTKTGADLYEYDFVVSFDKEGQAVSYKGQMNTYSPLKAGEWLVCSRDLNKGTKFYRLGEEARENHARKHNVIKELLNGSTFIVNVEPFFNNDGVWVSNARDALYRLIEDLEGEKDVRLANHNEIVNSLQQHRRDMRMVNIVEKNPELAERVASAPKLARTIILHKVGDIADVGTIDPKNLTNGMYMKIDAEGKEMGKTWLSKNDVTLEKQLVNMAVLKGVVALKLTEIARKQ